MLTGLAICAMLVFGSYFLSGMIATLIATVGMGNGFAWFVVGSLYVHREQEAELMA